MFLHVGPGGVDTLGGDPLQTVQDMVKNAETEMAHPHFVNIRKGQGEVDIDLRRIFPQATELPSQIAGRAADPGEDVFKFHDQSFFFREIDFLQEE
jgi:hypothetical protein